MIYDLYGNPVFSGMFETVPSNAFGFADPAGYRIGIICPCKHGDTVYASAPIVKDNAGVRGVVLVLDYVPATNTEDIPSANILATLEPNDVDNSYLIVPTEAKSIFLQYGWGSTVGDGYDPHSANNFTYFAQVNKPFADLPAYLTATQEESVFPNENADKAFAASLLKHFFPIVGKSCIVCGDSLTEQSATGQSSYTGAGTQVGNLLNTTYGLGWMQEIARKYLMRFDVRGNGSCCWYPYEASNVDAVARNACTDVDAIISAGVAYDYCIFAYGYNDAMLNNLGTADDMADNATGCGTIAAIRYCIEKMQETFPATKLLVVMPFYVGSDTGIASKIDHYYNMVLPVIQEYHVRTVDMEHNSGIVYGMGNPDGIHLATIADYNTNSDTEACRRYARCLEAELLKL